MLAGGIIPQEEYASLEAMGVVRVFGPGTMLPDIVGFIQSRWAERAGQPVK